METPYHIFQRNVQGQLRSLMIIKATTESAAQGSLPCVEFFINRDNSEAVQLARAEHLCAVLNGKML